MPQCANMRSCDYESTVPWQQEAEESVTLELPQTPNGPAQSEACTEMVCAQFHRQPEASMPIQLSPSKICRPGHGEGSTKPLDGYAEKPGCEAEANVDIRLEAPFPVTALPVDIGKKAQHAPLVTNSPIDHNRQAKVECLVDVDMKTTGETSLVKAVPHASRQSIPIRTSRSILKKLDAQGALPAGEVRDLAKKVKRAAKSEKKVEQDRAGIFLGELLSKVSEVFEQEVRDAQKEVEQARAAIEAGVVAQAEAEAQWHEAHQTVVQSKELLKEAEKSIECETQAIADAKKQQKCVASVVRTSWGRKRKLEDTVENIYQPLKEARIQGPACVKQVKVLDKIGKKEGFHPELLTVAPTVLKKPLDKRQTFDNITLSSLSSEFSKHIKVLDVEISNQEKALQECEQAMQTKQDALLAARCGRKESAQILAKAEVAVQKNREVVAAAKRSAQSLPLALKKAESELQKASIKVSKFRGGPVAAYMRVLPLPCVAAQVDDSDA